MSLDHARIVANSTDKFVEVSSISRASKDVE